MNNTPKRFGWVNASGLRLWRQKFELSQEALARRAGVSRATISSAENGHRLSFAQADAIAAVFGTTSDKLASGPDEDDGLAKPRFEPIDFSTMVMPSSMK